MRCGDFELEVLVNGKPAREYRHTDGNVYIEAREGSEYSLRVRNHSFDRCEAVITVDGLSIINGEQGTMDDTGYVIRGHNSPSIPGWRLNDNEVAKFVFGKRGESYASRSGKGSANCGVIGAAFFRERHKSPHIPWDWWETKRHPWGSSWICKGVKAPSTSWEATTTITNDMGAAASPVSNMMNYGTEDWSATTGGSSRRVQAASAGSPLRSTSLGTAFGGAQRYHVGRTEFERATPNEPSAVITIHYRTRQELIDMGVDLSGRPEIPNPFPADSGGGCPPPAGWHR